MHQSAGVRVCVLTQPERGQHARHGQAAQRGRRAPRGGGPERAEQLPRHVPGPDVELRPDGDGARRPSLPVASFQRDLYAAVKAEPTPERHPRLSLERGGRVGARQRRPAVPDHPRRRRHDHAGRDRVRRLRQHAQLRLRPQQPARRQHRLERFEPDAQRRLGRPVRGVRPHLARRVRRLFEPRSRDAAEGHHRDGLGDQRHRRHHRGAAGPALSEPVPLGLQAGLLVHVHLHAPGRSRAGLLGALRHELQPEDIRARTSTT